MVKPWQVVLATIGIFLAGLVTGGAITLRLARRISEKKVEQVVAREVGPVPLTRPANLNPEQLGPQLIHRFATSEQLNLGPGQRFKINQISRTTSEKLVRLRRETALNSLLLIEEMQDEISAILTAPQRVQFETLLSDQRQKMQEFRQKQQNELRKPDPAPVAPPQAAVQPPGN